MKFLARTFALVALTTLLAAPAAFAQFGDMAITKTGPDTATANTDVTYFVVVENVGADPASNVTVDDNIPAGMTFVSATQTAGTTPFICSDPGVGNNGPVSCTTATVIPGEGATLRFVFHISPMTAPGTVFTNIATVSTNPADDNEENNSSAAVTTVSPPPVADLGVTKTGPTTAGPNTDVVYTITLTNNGPDPAGALTLTDILPGTMTFVSLNQNPPLLSCTTPAVGANGTIMCTANSLAVGTPVTVTLTGHIPAGTQSGTEFQNTVTVTSANDPTEENDTASTSLTTTAVDVSVVKSGPAAAANAVVYTITVNNAGPDTATSVTLTDPLPPGTTLLGFSQNSGPPAACSVPPVGSGGTVTCGWDNYAPNASSQFTLTVNAGSNTSITNTATVVTQSYDTNPANQQSSVTTTITQSADLAVTKNGPATVTAGQNVTYTITATNNGYSNATNVTLSDTLPAGATFVSATQNSGPAFNCTGGATVNCTIATFNAGATATFTFVFTAGPGASGTFANTASINSSSTPDPNNTNNNSTTSATVAQSADVGITKTGPGGVTPGANATYTITVTNSGPSNASNVAWSDTLPPNTTFVSLTQNSGPTFTCTTGATVNCSIATLASGATATFTLVAAVSPATPSGGSIANTATVTASTPDPNNGNNSSTTTATVGASADLTVTKTGPATANAGQTINYTITVTNAGPSNAANVSLTDTTPANTTFASINQTSGPAFNCTTPAPGATGTVTCTVATLNAGATATFNLVLNVAPGAQGSITNSANVTSSTPEASPGNNSGSSAPAIVVGGGADVSITKTAGSGPFVAGGVASFDIVVTNNGPDVASGTTVTDVLPGGATLVSSSSTQGTCSGTTTVTCSVGTLANGGSATITLFVRLPQTAGPFANTATVTTSNPDPNGANNASTATVAVVLPGSVPALSPLALLLCAASLALAGWLVTRNT